MTFTVPILSYSHEVIPTTHSHDSTLFPFLFFPNNTIHINSHSYICTILK